MKRARTGQYVWAASLLVLASCSHVHSTTWLEDRVTPIEGSRRALAAEDDALVRVDWAQLAAERELVVSTFEGTPFEEEVRFEELVRQRVSSYGVGQIFAKAFVLPFYLGLLAPLWTGEDHHRDGKVGVVDKTIDFVAWVNPFQAIPDGGGSNRERTVDEGVRTERVYSGRPVPFATVRVELRSDDSVVSLVLITGEDGVARLPLDGRVERGRWHVHATWSTPRGTAEVGRVVWL